MVEMRFNECGCEPYREPCHDECHEHHRHHHMDCGCEFNKCNKINTKAIIDLIESIKETKRGLCLLEKGEHEIFDAMRELEEAFRELREAVCFIEKGEKEISESLLKVEEGLCELLRGSIC